jgi:hypothetical protein
VLTLLRLSAEERGRLSWRGLGGYLLWPGLRPQPFLAEVGRISNPSSSAKDGLEIRPTLEWKRLLGWGLVNLLVGGALLWGAPAVLPAEAPLIVRLVVGLVGFGWFMLLGVMDVVAVLYRLAGVPVEKLWDCPVAARSVADFWGQRWNRIFSGFARDTLFMPLAPLLGARGAAVAVFVFAGLLHEQGWSVAAEGGYGWPTLYFGIQCAGLQAESTRVGRALLRRSAWAGRAWALVVVLLPAPLLIHRPFLFNVVAPMLKDYGVKEVEEGERAQKKSGPPCGGPDDQTYLRVPSIPSVAWQP